MYQTSGGNGGNGGPGGGLGSIQARIIAGPPPIRKPCPWRPGFFQYGDGIFDDLGLPG